MSSSDDEGNGVPASGNVVNNNRANNSGIGSGSQNFGPGSGSHFGGNLNVGPGAVGEKSGPDSASINKLRGQPTFARKIRPQRRALDVGLSLHQQRQNSHGAEKDKANLGKVENLDEQIEQQKRVEEMEKSLAKMTELVLQLDKGLMSIKACLLCCLFACLLAAFYCAKYGTWATLP